MPLPSINTEVPLLITMVCLTELVPEAGSRKAGICAIVGAAVGVHVGAKVSPTWDGDGVVTAEKECKVASCVHMRVRVRVRVHVGAAVLVLVLVRQSEIQRCTSQTFV